MIEDHTLCAGSYLGARVGGTSNPTAHVFNQCKRQNQRLFISLKEAEKPLPESCLVTVRGRLAHVISNSICVPRLIWLRAEGVSHPISLHSLLSSYGSKIILNDITHCGQF